MNNYQCFVRLNKPTTVNSTVHTQNTRGKLVTKEEILGKKPLYILEKIRENLERLNEKMEVMIELQKHGRKDAQPLADAPLDVMTLLSMPDHLRKTAMAICRCGRATAEEISQQTSRARAVESAYLNQLVIMGHLKKERKGRKAYFYADRESQG
ncbi:transcriptional regulator [Candidatus Bathyarchaeota archaeon]|nr:transcriptional regulator [Candidatus Bathyarchaeota archaeon]